MIEVGSYIFSMVQTSVRILNRTISSVLATELDLANVLREERDL